jgi:hypothetical protein
VTIPDVWGVIRKPVGMIHTVGGRSTTSTENPALLPVLQASFGHELYPLRLESSLSPEAAVDGLIMKQVVERLLASATASDGPDHLDGRLRSVSMDKGGFAGKTGRLRFHHF